MTNKQILETAIQKAIDAGWGPWNAPVTVKQFDHDIFCYIDGERWNYEAFIFNHDFAKALWGEERIVNIKNYQALKRMGWQFHLQQMVIAEDSIAYLGENL